MTPTRQTMSGRTTQYRRAAVAGRFQFRLRNATGKPASYRFEVDAYELPAAPACGPRIEQGKRPTFSGADETGARGAWAGPVPGARGLDGRTQSRLTDADAGPGDQRHCENHATCRLHRQKTFNVNARAGDTFAGGVSLTVATA